jgi:hypothetical protein
MSRCGKALFTAVICSIFSLSLGLQAQTTAQCGTQGLVIPAPAGPNSQLTDLDDKGNILGWFVSGPGTAGFLLSQGTLAHFRFPGSVETLPRDMNKNSVIVGSYDLVANGPQHAFMVRNGAFSEIKLPGFPNAPVTANGITDLGDITGQLLANGVQQGYLLHQGKVTLISFPGATGGTFPTSINNAGVIVGTYKIGGPGSFNHGFMWKSGVFTTVDVPGSQDTSPTKINDNNVIVGDNIDSLGVGRGFALSKGQFFNLVPNSAGTEITALNNFNNVLGDEESSKSSFPFKGFCGTVF